MGCFGGQILLKILDRILDRILGGRTEDSLLYFEDLYGNYKNTLFYLHDSLILAVVMGDLVAHMHVPMMLLMSEQWLVIK